MVFMRVSGIAVSRVSAPDEFGHQFAEAGDYCNAASIVPELCPKSLCEIVEAARD